MKFRKEKLKIGTMCSNVLFAGIELDILFFPQVNYNKLIEQFILKQVRGNYM